MRFWRVQLSIVRGETLSSFASSFLQISLRCILTPEPIAVGVVWSDVVVIVTLSGNVRLREKLPICAHLPGSILDLALKGLFHSRPFLIGFRRIVAPESLPIVKV
jgi:hypothetical protein